MASQCIHQWSDSEFSKKSVIKTAVHYIPRQLAVFTLQPFSIVDPLFCEWSTLQATYAFYSGPYVQTHTLTYISPINLTIHTYIHEFTGGLLECLSWLKLLSLLEAQTLVIIHFEFWYVQIGHTSWCVQCILF